MNKIILIILCIIASSCVNTSEQFKPAGFNSASEAGEYVPEYLYYAHALTKDDWDMFYREFPEYWKDMQQGKAMGASLEFHPWYTAYSFKWNTKRRSKLWDQESIDRLYKKKLKAEDDIFKVIYALGPPKRVVWNNYFEILLYKPDLAIIMDKGFYKSTSRCSKCYESDSDVLNTGMSDNDVLKVLGLKAPVIN
jgi:hypothetical protein